MTTNNCPCQSGKTYNQCCRPYHDGKAAPTAEALMRSRYTAYALCNGAYLHRSWHTSTRPNKKSLMQLPPTDWLGLEILRTEQGGEQDEKGVVEFVARYHEGGLEQAMHQVSRFVHEGKRWYYLDGETVGD